MVASINNNGGNEVVVVQASDNEGEAQVLFRASQLLREKVWSMKWQVLRMCISFIMTMATYYIALTSQEAGKLCPTSPVSWTTFFLGNVVVSLIFLAVMALMFWSTFLMMNKHMFAAAIYRERGDGAAAAREAAAGMASARLGRRILKLVAIPMILLALFALCWGIIGWVVYAASRGEGENEHCRKMESWFYVVFAVSLAMPLWQQRQKKGECVAPTRNPQELAQVQVVGRSADAADAAVQEGGGENTETSAAALRGEDKKEHKETNAKLASAVRQLLSSPFTKDLPEELFAQAVQAEVARIRGGGGDGGAEFVGRYGPQPPKFEELSQIGLLGCGGFGKVELFEHPSTESVFAVKSVNKGYTVKAGMFDTLKTEKMALCAARSPFVTRFFGSRESTQWVLLMLEACLGGELYSTYKAKALYGSVPHAKYYTASVAMALRHLHGMSLICRGIKPEDCLLDSAGRLKLCDLGLAKFAVDKTFTTCGTPDYFAPEVVGSFGHHAGYDWWALGVLMFELLAGDPPFQSGYPMQIYSKVMKGIDEVKFPSKVQGDAKALVQALLQKEPDQRLPLQSNGWDSFKGHPWFKDLDWVGMANRTSTPPYIPEVKNLRDMHNFNAKAEDIPKIVPLEGGSNLDWGTEFGAPE